MSPTPLRPPMAKGLPQFASAADRASAAAFLKDRPAAAATVEQVRHYLASLGPMEMASTKSRIAFVAATRFLWVHQANLDGAITVGFLLPRRVESPRLRSGPAGGRWSHHVKLTMLDPQLKAWFREAYETDRGVLDEAPRKVPGRRPAKAAKPRWTCPTCGQEFLRKGQSHSCDRRAVEELFADYPAAVKVTQVVKAHLDHVAAAAGEPEDAGGVRMAATKTQVSFAARRRFAFVWVPEQAAGHGKPDTPVVSFLLRRRETDSRVKESVQVGREAWQHHVVARSARQVDRQVKAWLAEAYATVGAA